MKLEYLVGDPEDGKTVKYILKNCLELSERLVKKLKFAGRILQNGEAVYVNNIVNKGDLVTAYIDFDDEPSDVIPEDLSINIIYEDEWLVAVNKSPSTVVHPTSTHITGTVANALTYHMLKSGVSKKVRPVSRLDRDTTGIIIFAKNQYTQEFLVKQMSRGIYEKKYIGIVQGTLPDGQGTIDLPIERKPGSIMLRHTSPTGSKAVTHYRVIEALRNAAMCEFILETGRTHQIRVHCQAIGHPLLGDTLYSDLQTDLIGRQALHSHNVSFIHPQTRKLLSLKAPIPDDILGALEILRK